MIFTEIMLEGTPSQIRAILFDLHHTITKTRVGMLDLTREAAASTGIDFSGFTDAEIKAAIQTADKFMKDFQVENKVDIHWGGEPEQWFAINKVMIESLGIRDVSEEQLIAFESYWKNIMATNWESLVEGAKETLEELHRRGYILGICTRRHDDPEELLKRWEIHHLLSTVHYTAVPGYAKPSPFTLLKAAEDIKINPRLCAYVGNYVDADVDASLSAEMLPVLTIWSDQKEKNLAPDGIIVINEIKELLDLFEGPPN